MRSTLVKISALVFLLNSFQKQLFCDEQKLVYLKQPILQEEVYIENEPDFFKKIENEKILNCVNKYYKEDWVEGLGPLSSIGLLYDKCEEIKDNLQDKLKKKINDNWETGLYCDDDINEIGFKVTGKF